jgi:creatinine amidohydrolase
MSDQDGSTARGEEGRSYALEDLSWEEIRDHLRSDPRLLFPVTALEQYGPHLPLGTGAFIVERLVADVSGATGVLRAPILSYGVNLPAQPPWPGTASLRRKTFHRTVNELVAAWEDGGVRQIVAVTFQTYEPHVDALLMAFTTRAKTTVVDLGSVVVHDILESPRVLDHAGEFATSLMLHLAPEKVRLRARVDVSVPAGKYRKYVRGRAPTPPREGTGVLGSPSLATAAKGERLWSRLRDALLSAVEAEHG